MKSAILFLMRLAVLVLSVWRWYRLLRQPIATSF